MGVSPRVYWWTVQAINRGTGETFERSLVLDTAETSASPEELADLDRLSLQPLDGFAITKYRRYFHEEAGFDVFSPSLNFSTISVEDYYEDEDGKPLSKHEFFDLVTGEEETILAGEPDSVLRLPPADMATPEAWTVEKANVVDHFLEVVSYLAGSEWVRTPTKYGYRKDEGTQNEVSEFQCPNVYVTNGVLVFLRQLFADNDDLLGRAVRVYTAHCSDEVKRAWVLERKTAFDEMLKRQPFPDLTGVSTKDVLGLFLYGFGLIHWGDKERDRTKQREFRELVGQHGRERVVFAFQTALQYVAGYSSHVAAPIARDMEHWTKVQGHAAPDRVRLLELLG